MKTLKSFRAMMDEDGGAAAVGGGGTGAVAANVTGDSSTMAMPPSMNPMGTVKRRKFRLFEVESATFNKFQKGETTLERWSGHLDQKSAKHQEIYNYAKANRDHLIVLRDATTGALRAIRRGE